MRKSCVLTIMVLFMFTWVKGQNQLTVHVHKVPDSIGKISVALYKDSDSFLNFKEVYKANSKHAEKGITEVSFGNLPNGEYAIALFYDQNSNDKLDTNWMGIPKEKVAFSNAKMKLFGPPNFKECAFKLKGDTLLDISL